ncbi:MAG: CocE/NonD family hydrolase [Phycisphaerales bacterium]|nr:MAG: CocE/NonD family hydrolase [Phycisphaerales bacterium]
MNKSLCAILVLTILLSPQAVRYAKAALEVEVRTDVRIPMRDGTELSANIFLPRAKGTFPVILIRSPYGKGNEKYSDGHFYAGRGYALVIQDCRGKGTSGGLWEPFVNDENDGRAKRPE